MNGMSGATAAGWRMWALALILAATVGAAAGYGARVEQERRANAALYRSRLADPGANGPYRHRVSHMAALPDGPTVVMLGDSLTANAEWSELLRPDIANRGISNDTTLGLLKRLDVSTPASTRQVFLMIGINDLALYRNPPETVAANTRRIVERLKGRQVFVQSVLPGRAAGLNRAVATVNRLNKAYCATGACAYVDLTPAVAPTGILDEDMSFDGRHLRGEGYRRWADLIRPMIGPPPVRRVG